MAKKALLKDSKGFEILPITRGELVLDSSGNMALHSREFLASQNSPGLISSEDKKKIDDMIASSVEQPFTISINEGITLGKDYYTYNGSYPTKINIKEGDNIKFDTSNNQLEIHSINTTYTLSGKFDGGFVNTLEDCFGNKSTSTIPIMSPATEISDGGYGLVPYPKATQQNKYLRGDGTWETPQDTTYPVVSKTLDGLSPKIGTKPSAIIANPEDEWVLTSTKGGTPSWRNLPLNAFKNDNDNTTYELEGLRDGNKYIISLVSNDEITSTINIPRMVGASELSDGKAGLVPLPLKTESLLYFRGDGTWATPKDTTYSAFIGASSSVGGKEGLVPKPVAGDQNKVLGASGSWIALPTIAIDDKEEGNAITDVTADGHNITLKRGTNFVSMEYLKSNYYDIHTKQTKNTVFAAPDGKDGEAIFRTLTVGDIPNLATNKITALTNYSKATKVEALSTTDSLNTALGKLEYKADLGKSAYDIVQAAYDGDGTIENLKEILNVLDGLSDTVTLQTIIGNYLLKNDINPSLGIKENTINVNVGGKASSYITVPYADTATIMSSFDAASSSNTKRYVWMSWDDNTGKPAYTSKLTFQTSTNTLFVNDKAVSLDGHGHSNYATITQLADYLPLTGGTITGELHTNIFHINTNNFSLENSGTFWIGVDTNGELFRTDKGWYNSYRILDSTNYTSYTVKKDGTGATGTWGINISGSAGSVAWNNVTGKPDSPFKNHGKITSSTILTDLTTGIGYTHGYDPTGLDAYNFGELFTLKGTVQLTQIYFADGGRPYITATWDSTKLSSRTWKQIAFTSDIPTSLKNPNTLKLSAGTFVAKTYDGSSAVTVNIPTLTSHLTNNSGFITLDHTHSDYYSASASRTKNTVLAAPNGSAGAATFRALVIADLPTHTYTSVQSLGWTGTIGATKIPTMDAIAYWNGAYSGTTSNLAYCVKGAFGTMATKNASDYATTASLANYLPLAGGTMTGCITTPGDDSVVIKPAKNNYDQVGASDCKFWKIFATTFYGDLSGDVTGDVTGNCSGSSGSCTGNAATATRLASITASTSTLYVTGCTSSTSKLYSGTQSTSGVRIVSGSKLYAASGFFQESDERLKEFFNPISVDLEKLKKLRKNYFKFKGDDTMHIGVSAQEIKELYPEVVSETDNIYNVDYSKLAVVALKGIDVLYDMILELKEENRELRRLANL